MPRRKWIEELEWTPVSTEEFQRLSSLDKILRVRHSCAHILASAIKARWPDTCFANGPATSTGFYYDVRSETKIKTEDIPVIQTEFDAIVEASYPFQFSGARKVDVEEYFRQIGDQLKLDILQSIEASEVTLYKHGDFVDLCSGPHVPSTSYCRYAEITSISASHWHGETIPSLTRIAGTAWLSRKDLRGYKTFLDEAKSRDHRVLGPMLDFFSFHEWAASPLWHPKGVILRRAFIDQWRRTIDKAGYVEVLNPLLYRPELFETSGHWEHFSTGMFTFREKDGAVSWALKPMNCPDTMLFFRSRKRSYRELPMRVAESQVLHRNEPTGSLHGIMRARNFEQDDAHIFVGETDLLSEISALLKMIDDSYVAFGLEYEIRLSTRPQSYLGHTDLWDKAESSLVTALMSAAKSYSVQRPGPEPGRRAHD